MLQDAREGKAAPPSCTSRPISFSLFSGKTYKLPSLHRALSPSHSLPWECYLEGGSVGMGDCPILPGRMNTEGGRGHLLSPGPSGPFPLPHSARLESVSSTPPPPS